MFRKLAKCFLRLTVLGGIAATIYYLYMNHTSEDLSEDTIPEEMDTFDLDSDLEPIGKREYVSLNISSAGTDTGEDEEAVEKEA